VLASPLVLNAPHRIDWKACAASKEEETASAKSMRHNFQPYDFNSWVDVHYCPFYSHSFWIWYTVIFSDMDCNVHVFMLLICVLLWHSIASLKQIVISGSPFWKSIGSEGRGTSRRNWNLSTTFNGVNSFHLSTSYISM